VTRARIATLRRSLVPFALLACMALAATSASADEYDARRAGHPLRVLGYILHPVGVALDWLIFRPAHWAGSQPAFAYLFGHDVDEEPQR
jgi:hypothetical protein